MTESNGTAATYKYDRWGHSESYQVWEGGLPSGRANRARYKGAMWMGGEGVELYFMRARWYEPMTGRFLSEDPIGLEGGINQYVYAGNNPVMNSDPTGLATRCRYWGNVLVDANTGQVLGVEILDWMCWEVGDVDEDLRKLRGRETEMLFPADVDSSKPTDRWFMSRRLRWAYDRAGLEPFRGGLWHPFRRKFATERKHMPVVDVALAGGWKETRMLLECYQRPDEATLQQVVLEAPKLCSDGLRVGRNYSNSYSKSRRGWRSPAA